MRRDSAATPTEERFDRGAVVLAERDAQRTCLRDGEVVAQPGSLVSSRRCSAANANGASTSRPWVRSALRFAGLADEPLQEGGLADARFTTDHHAAGRTAPCPIKEFGQGVRFRARGRLAPCDRTPAQGPT